MTLIIEISCAKLVAYNLDVGIFVDAARIVCEAGSMLWSGVRPSVSLSVCLSHKSTKATAAGRFAAEHPVGSRCRSIAAGALARGAGAQQQMQTSSR